MLAFFVSGQAAIGWFVSWVRPQLRDWEYSIILTGLKDRLAKQPQKPLIVLLGSSRGAAILRPSTLPQDSFGDTSPLVYNCSSLASGPIRELQVFHRLLAAGIQPDWLFIEVWAPYLAQRIMWWEEQSIGTRDLQLADRAILPYCPDLRRKLRHLLWENLLVPGFAFRQNLLQCWAPYLLTRDAAAPQNGWVDPARRHSEDGWLDPPGESHPLKPGTLECGIWQANLRVICDPFRVHPPADLALRDLLRLAAERGIRTCLLLCPEPSTLRGPAGMDTWAAHCAYLEELSREYGPPVIDTRSWVPDDEFTDFSHVATQAVVPYTQRFGREVLGPMVAGQAPDARLLLKTQWFSPPSTNTAH
jgi:hypothetical protein